MKKIVFAALTCLVLNNFAQENNTWRLGVQWGFQGNRAEFSGGRTDAHARFHQNPFGGGAIDIIGRYDYNKHWMIMTGLGFNSCGFEFALAENYSLLTKNKVSHFSTIKSEFGSLQIPVMLFYKFNPNCKNSRWLIGGGIAETFAGDDVVSRSFENIPDGKGNYNYLSSEAHSNGGVYWMARWSVAREKIFKRGSILNASVMFNVGFRKMAEATVEYTVDGQTYSHQYINNGNFIGFRIAYFFKPLFNPWNRTKSKSEAITPLVN